jgi:hypothetical protein
MNQIKAWLDPHTWVLLNIQWSDSHWWVWVLTGIFVTALLAAYNLRVVDSKRDFWADRLVLGEFSPQSCYQSRSLWLQWIAIVALLTTASFSPNVTTMPQMVEAGSVEWQNVFDVSNSQAAQDTRPYYAAVSGEKDPGKVYQWGTRMDMNKALFKRDLLPQLKDNKAGVITVEGTGYNMWDVTSDIGPGGALLHMLDQFVQPGSAPGGGCDYTSGIKAALDDFDLISSIEKKQGDTGDKVRFIALYTDGGFSGDEQALMKMLDELVKRQVRLLIVDDAGSVPYTVGKYDVHTHKANGESFDGTTASTPGLLLKMVNRMQGLGTIIIAQQPGVYGMSGPEKATADVLEAQGHLLYTPYSNMQLKYNIPQKAGGLYSRPAHSNLKPILLTIVMLLFFSVTTGGGGFPRLRYILPTLRGARISSALKSIKSRFGIGRN